MTTQNYLMINETTNIVENVCLWDGNPDTWQPPVDYLMLVQTTTPAMVWEAVIVDGKITDFVLGEQIGASDIGFTWNSTTQVLTTNQPKPSVPQQEQQ